MKAFVAWDCAALGCAGYAIYLWLMGSWGLPGPALAETWQLGDSLNYGLSFLVLLTVWSVLFFQLGHYRSRRLSRFRVEARDIVTATGCCGLMFWAVLALLHGLQLLDGAQAFVVFWLISMSLMLGGRILMRLLLRYMRLHGRNLRFVLIFGTSRKAQAYARSLMSMPGLGYRIVGFVDDANAQSLATNLPAPLVANYQNFSNFVHDNVVDEIVIFTPPDTHAEEVAAVLEMSNEQGIVMRIQHARLHELPHAGGVKEKVGSEVVTTIYNTPLLDNQFLIKRAIDVVVSGLLLVLLLPVFIVTAIWVKVDSSGPVLFRQKRVGLNKRLFWIYKFRTMVVDAESKIDELDHLNEAQGPVFKIRSDPRITRAGVILRRSSIDELPQLLNVFKGDMSLVGPRPLPERDVSGFTSSWHRRRFSVRPGITCLWQIEGRSNIAFEQWMELDMNYIDRWSLWLDLKILFKTIPAILFGTGAQ